MSIKHSRISYVVISKVCLYLIGLSSLILSCSGSVIKRVDAPPTLPPPPVKRGYLSLPPGPAHARIYLDDRYIGCYRDYPRETILMSEGEHLLRVSADGYAHLYVEVRISRAQPVELSRPLIALPTD